MNAWHGLSPLSLLPPLALQQLFHAVIWLAVLSWLGVQCLPSYDRRWRCVAEIGPLPPAGPLSAGAGEVGAMGMSMEIDQPVQKATGKRSRARFAGRKLLASSFLFTNSPFRFSTVFVMIIVFKYLPLHCIEAHD